MRIPKVPIIDINVKDTINSFENLKRTTSISKEMKVDAIWNGLFTLAQHGITIPPENMLLYDIQTEVRRNRYNACIGDTQCKLYDELAQLDKDDVHELYEYVMNLLEDI